MIPDISGTSATSHLNQSSVSTHTAANGSGPQPAIRSPQYQVNINNGDEAKGSNVGDFIGNMFKQGMKLLTDLVGEASKIGGGLLSMVSNAAAPIMKILNPFK